MSYTCVFQASMEFGLKLMTIISSNGIDSEWESADNVIYKINCILLRMPLVNFQGANSGCIINGSILKTPDFLTFLNSKIKEFHINLQVMPGTCFS